MQSYEYKVIPAPSRGKRAKGLKSTQDRFANALSLLMNEMSADGWEFQRSETLPCEERSGLTGKTVKTQNVLVFRRAPAPATVTPKRVEPKVAAPKEPALSEEEAEWDYDDAEEAK